MRKAWLFSPEFADMTVTRHVLDAPTVPANTLDLLNDCVERVVRDRVFDPNSYRAGQVHGLRFAQANPGVALRVRRGRRAGGCSFCQWRLVADRHRHADRDPAGHSDRLVVLRDAEVFDALRAGRRRLSA